MHTLRTKPDSLSSLLFLLILFTGLSIAGAQDADPSNQKTTAEKKAKRVALVIGNSAYETRLENPVNDAKAISKSLTALDFEVSTSVDCNRQQMIDLVKSNSEGLGEGDVFVFYFAGNGVMVEGIDYLLPIEVKKLESASDVGKSAITVNQLLEVVDEECAKAVLIDASRANLFKTELMNRQAVSTSISPIPKNLLIAFSTAPGSVAIDGNGDLSPFAQAMVEAMEERPEGGLSMTDAFSKAAIELRTIADNQRPFLSRDAAMPPIYLSKPTSIVEAVKDK